MGDELLGSLREYSEGGRTGDESTAVLSPQLAWSWAAVLSEAKLKQGVD